MDDMSSTFDTFHVEMSASNLPLRLNRAMVVTFETSQCEMSPWIAASRNASRRLLVCDRSGASEALKMKGSLGAPLLSLANWRAVSPSESGPHWSTSRFGLETCDCPYD